MSGSTSTSGAVLENAKRPKICIVTKEIIGPFRNGGIARANHGLATTLKSVADVTVCYCTLNDGEPLCVSKTFADWIKYYMDLGITLVALKIPETVKSRAPAAQAVAVYNFLRPNIFDVVYGDDYGGLLFYSIMARRAGMLNCPIVVTAHSGHDWLSDVNMSPPATLDHIRLMSMERYCYKYCDLLVSPSQYMLDYLRSRGIELSPEALVNLNVTDPAETEEAASRFGETLKVDEIVFFGRLELRKGLVVFCDALAKVSKVRKPNITFLGKFEYIDGVNAGAYVLERLKKIGLTPALIPNLDSDEAIKYLSQPRRLAVMPSPVDNSPCVILECLRAGIPFIGTSQGGGPELGDDVTAETCFVDPDSTDLASKILRALEDGARVGVPRYSYRHIQTRTIEIMRSLLASAKSTGAKAPLLQPRVTACVVHYNQGYLLRQALRALHNQTYTNFQVIVVDDGSTDEYAIDTFDELEDKYSNPNWIFIRQTNSYLGAARNAAVSRADGEYLIFFDDDNVPEHDLIESFVQASLHSGAPIVSSLHSANFGVTGSSSQNARYIAYFPLGSAGLMSGLIFNDFGDANSLIKQSAFEALGGFDETRNFACQDWRMFAKAAISGLDHVVIPEPAYHYRVREDSMFRTANPVQNVRPIAAEYAVLPLERMAAIIDLVQKEMGASDVAGAARGKLEKAYGSITSAALTQSAPNSREAMVAIAIVYTALHGVAAAKAFAAQVKMSVDDWESVLRSFHGLRKPRTPESLILSPLREFDLLRPTLPFVHLSPATAEYHKPTWDNGRIRFHANAKTVNVVALPLGDVAAESASAYLLIMEYPGKLGFGFALAPSLIDPREMSIEAFQKAYPNGDFKLATAGERITLNAKPDGVIDVGEELFGFVCVFTMPGQSDYFATFWIEKAHVQFRKDKAAKAPPKARPNIGGLSRIALSQVVLSTLEVVERGQEKYANFQHDGANWFIHPSMTSSTIVRGQLIPTDFRAVELSVRLPDANAAGVSFRAALYGGKRFDTLLVEEMCVVRPDSGVVTLSLSGEFSEPDGDAFCLELGVSTLPGQKDWFCKLVIEEVVVAL